MSSKARIITLWIGSVFLALMFLVSGVAKFTDPATADQFRTWGYADAFRVLIGVLELAGAVLLLVPRGAFYAAGVLAVIMLGAAGTHLRAGEVRQSVVPLLFFIMLVGIAYLRRPRATALSH